MYHDVHPSFTGISFREHAALTQAERQILREEQLLQQMAIAERDGIFD